MSLMPSFKNILVPIDFSGSSRDAMNVAIELARALGAKVTLLHVWDVPVYGYSAVPYVPADLAGDVERSARADLDGTLAEVKHRLPEANALLRRGDTPSEILATAEHANAR